jgi:hypothetical protein
VKASNRPMVKMLHADGFFPAGDVERCVAAVRDVRFSEKEYGYELENFNMVLGGVEPILSRVLGERVIVEHKNSGIFRRPFNNIIHFENFDSLNEWCFIVALEKNTLNLFHHKDKKGAIDAKSALEGWQFNYRNLFEWDLHTNVLLEPNQGVFIRPWVFHTLDSNLVQYYRLITDRHFRVLLMGKPGSSRKSVAQELSKHFKDSTVLHSKEQRIIHKDIDYTEGGRLRHTNRLLTMARNSGSDDIVIIDSVCPLEEQRNILNPDLIFWIDDTKESFEEFKEPLLYDSRYTVINNEAIEDMVRRIKSKR